MRWPTEYGKITQEFGARPEFYQKFGLPGHEGIDFMAPEGSELYAVADGFVSDVRLDGNSDPNGKPYGNQIRIQHEGGFTSIYAHLSEVVVTRGQFVQAGQLIGLAGNTGNSFGAHLHFTLKKQGATQSDATNYPHDIIDPTPYLKPFGGSKPEQPSPPTETTIDVQVDSPEVGYLNVRSAPYVGSDLVTKVDHGETLGALEEADIARSKVGKNGQWLWVRTPMGKTGYVAAWYIKLPPPEPTPEKEAEVTLVKVDSPEVPLKLRSGPGIGYAQIDQMPDGATLKALEPPAEVRRKIGQHGAWLQVQTPAGEEGYTAAWYLKLEKTSAPAIPTPATGKPTKYVQVESPEFGLRVRGGPSTDHDQVWWIPHGTMLTSLEDERTTGRKVGQEDEWLHVRTPALWEGYVAAWYLKAPEGEDQRQPATQMDLRTGLSPHIQGIHAVTLGDDLRTRDPIRSLFESRNKKGWVFFTEVCGRQPQHVHLNGDLRNRLWDWADQGYGVIVRLNNGYEPNGTLPERKYYDDFAAAAARWTELYLKRPDRSQSEYTWTIQIANEQNNPREHPGGFEHPREHITAEMYAEAFNKTYAQIKAVLPNSHRLHRRGRSLQLYAAQAAGQRPLAPAGLLHHDVRPHRRARRHHPPRLPPRPRSQARHRIGQVRQRLRPVRRSLLRFPDLSPLYGAHPRQMEGCARLHHRDEPHLPPARRPDLQRSQRDGLGQSESGHRPGDFQRNRPLEPNPPTRSRSAAACSTAGWAMRGRCTTGPASWTISNNRWMRTIAGAPPRPAPPISPSVRWPPNLK